MVQRTCRQAGRSSHRSQSWWVDCGRKEAQATRLPEFQKNGIPNHTRIIPESYPIHASNFPSLNHGTFAKSGLVFCELFFFATTRHPLRLLLLLRKIRQQHPAAKVAARNGTSMPTPKRTRHSDRTRAAATAGQLQSAPRVV